MKKTGQILLLLLFIMAPVYLFSAQLSKEKMVEILAGIDQRVKNNGDYKSLVYMEQRKKDEPDVVFQMIVFRRDLDQKLMMLFTQPKSETGKGYIRIDKNLWYYDPIVGKWDRRTDREHIGGTDSNRQDFDQSDLAGEYDPEYIGEEKLGNFTVWHLKLTGKQGQDLSYPIVELWVDENTGNDLKRQDFALSGRLLRTSYSPAWEKLYSESKKSYLWYRKKIMIYDEVDKGNSTIIVIKSIDLSTLPENIFTKAWMETQSR